MRRTGVTRLLLGRLDFHIPGLVGLRKVGSDSCWEGSSQGQGWDERPDTSWACSTTVLMLPKGVNTDPARLRAQFPARRALLQMLARSWGFFKLPALPADTPQLATNSGVPVTSPATPRFSHLLDQLMELRKVLDYKDGVIIKAVSRGHPNEETYKGGSGGSRMLSSCVFSQWNQDMWRHPPGIPVCSPAGKLL